MKKTALIFFLILMLLNICSCEQAKSNNTVLQANGTENIIIYDKFDQQLVLYNKNNHSIESSKPVDNFFYFEFDTRSNYYTSGHSINNGFKILKKENNLVRVVYELKSKSQAIFPFATNGEKNIFMIQDDNDKLHRKIADFNGEKLAYFDNVKGCIEKGVIIGNTLYYTVYESEKEKYTLYSVNIENISNQPSLIEDGLESKDIYSYNDELYKSTKKEIFNDHNRFKKAELNYFDDTNNVLLQIGVDQKRALLKLDIVNTKSKNIQKTVDNVIGYDINNNILTVYCFGGIEKIDLESK